jgi:hypothetical protein
VKNETSEEHFEASTERLMFIYVKLLGTTLMGKTINMHSFLGNYSEKIIIVQFVYRRN